MRFIIVPEIDVKPKARDDLHQINILKDPSRLLLKYPQLKHPIKRHL